MYRSAHVDLAGPLRKKSDQIIFGNDDYLYFEPSLAGVARVARDDVQYAGIRESHMISFTSSRVALAGAWPPDMFLSREALEEASPSRQHGIDGRLEASYRWSYCEFLKDSGIELKMCGFLLLVITRHLRTEPSSRYFQYFTSRRPQLTIATASVFCHRFFASHSHGAPADDRYVREA